MTYRITGFNREFCSIPAPGSYDLEVFFLYVALVLCIDRLDDADKHVFVRWGMLISRDSINQQGPYHVGSKQRRHRSPTTVSFLGVI